MPIASNILAVIAPPPAGTEGHALVAAVLFYIFAILTGGSAIAVLISRNIVRMAVALLLSLAGVAGLYFLLGAEFLAAVQLVVYAGGTMILIIFGVMLTSKSPFSRFEPTRGQVTASIICGIALLASLVVAMVWGGSSAARFAHQPLVGQQYPLESLGQALLGDYLLPFELSSVLLLVVMIGAAFLAKGRRRPGR